MFNFKCNRKEQYQFFDLLKMKEDIIKTQKARIKSGLYINWLRESKTALSIGSNIKEHLNPDKINDLDFHVNLEFDSFITRNEK